MALGTTEHEVADIEIPLTISGSVVDSDEHQETDKEVDTHEDED